MLHYKLRSFFTLFPATITDPYSRRKAFIVKIILIGSFIVSFCTTILSYLSLVLYEPINEENPPHIMVLITTLIFLILLFAKKGNYQATSFGLILVFLIPTIYGLYTWTIYNVSSMLIISFLIILSGFMLGKTISLAFTIIVIVLVISITLFQQAIDSQAHAWMKQQTIDPIDGVVYGMLFSIISFVSWLSNHEIKNLQLRAHASELQLNKERDLLELKILQRTRDIERLEGDKVRHLYRFATLGKLTSGLFHDLVNPLTIVSYNLKELETKHSEKQSHQLAETQMLVKNALEGTKRLELFIETVKKQVQNQQTTQLFSLTKEIKEVLELFYHTAKQDHITMTIKKQKEIHYKGNPIRFNQLLSNLLSNAMDACVHSNTSSKRITISLSKKSSLITLSITDYGEGIHPDHLPHLFEPLFTTKSQKQGTGLGLSIVKDIVEFELNGTINVMSKPSKGTVITITFPERK